MLNKLFFSIFAFLLLIHSTQSATTYNGPTNSSKSFSQTVFEEVCRIRIENKKQGTIQTSQNKGLTFQKIGKVIYPASSLRTKGYTASRWSHAGNVCATAVNAIHIKTDHNQKIDKGIIFSILPKESLYYGISKNAIYTNIKGGNALFGGKFSPFVGSPVYLIKNGIYQKLPKGYSPKQGDTLEVVVLKAKKTPTQIIFENRFGGKITAKYLDNSSEIIGTVYSPVQGVGRFIGSEKASPGRIRANHSGVICISTSPIGKTGGFQIVPSQHSMSPEMTKTRLKTQWMVIGPKNVEEPSQENIPPFFFGYFRPRQLKNAILSENWREQLLDQFIVEVKEKNSSWKAMPARWYSLKKKLPQKADSDLKNITHIRIMFPIIKENIEKLVLPEGYWG